MRWCTALQIGAVWLGACGGGRATSGDAATADAATADAVTGDGATADGATVDAAMIVDAAVDGAAMFPVTVHALGRASSGTGPRAGVHVLSYAPDGTLAGRTTTDAHGDAIAHVPEGGAITVVEDIERQLTTIAGVEAGDELTVGDHYWPLPVRHAMIALPPGPGADDRYVVAIPCGGSGDLGPSPVMLTMLQCTPPSGPAIATSYRPFLTTLVLSGYIYDPQVSLQEGGTATIAGPWLPPINFQLAVTAPPGLGGEFTTERIAGGERLTNGNSGSIDFGQAHQFLLPGGGDGLLTGLVLHHNEAPFGHSTILEYRTGMPTSLVGDLSSDLLSRPVDVQWTEGELAPGGASGVTGARWTMTGAGDRDGIVIETEVVTPAYDITRWTVVLPPGGVGTTLFRLSQLPPDLLGVWSDRMISKLFVHAVDASASSYAEFRRTAQPELAWRWMRSPMTPSKVRMATSYGQRGQ